MKAKHISSNVLLFTVSFRLLGGAPSQPVLGDPARLRLCASVLISHGPHLANIPRKGSLYRAEVRSHAGQAPGYVGRTAYAAGGFANAAAIALAGHRRAVISKASLGTIGTCV